MYLLVKVVLAGPSPLACTRLAQACRRELCYGRTYRERLKHRRPPRINGQEPNPQKALCVRIILPDAVQLFQCGFSQKPQMNVTLNPL
jgi:hypothetical protein